MRPAKPDAAAQADMFRETLEAILDLGHELLELSRRIDWAKLDAACAASASPWPAPALMPTSSRSPMPDYAADPALSACKPVPSTRKTSPEPKPAASGVKTRAKLLTSQHASPETNVIPRHQPVPVRIPG